MVSERVARASPGSGPAETLGIANADDERHRAARMNAAVATVRTPRRFPRDRDAARPSSDTPGFRLFLPHSSSVAKSPGGAAFYRAGWARTSRDARKAQKPEHFSRTSNFFEKTPLEFSFFRDCAARDFPLDSSLNQRATRKNARSSVGHLGVPPRGKRRTSSPVRERRDARRNRRRT